MLNTFRVDPVCKNAEYPFTELFSLLRKNDGITRLTSASMSDDLKALQQHTNNAIELLLQGLQDFGQLISVVASVKKEIIQDLNNIGFFISAIGNLTEALNTLRLDLS